MKQNQFSLVERFGYNVLANMPFKENLIKIANSYRINKIKNLKTPINVVYYITNKCNSRCKHCFYWKKLNKKDDEMGINEIVMVARSLKHPLEMLSVTGGEPFLRNDVSQVCKAFYKLNKTKRINIATNGFLTETIVRNVSKILKENPGKRLTLFISLDGLEKTHDSMRGVKGAFKKAVETITALKRIRSPDLSIFAATTICKENYKEISALIRYVRKFGVIHKFNLLRNNSSVFCIDKSILQDFDPKQSKLPTMQELEEVYNLIKCNRNISTKVESLKIRYSIDMIKNQKPIVKCLARLTDGVIFPDGDVSICEPVKPFGNLRETDYNMYNLWNSTKVREIKSKLSNCFCMQSCNLLNSMKYDTETLKRIL